MAENNASQQGINFNETEWEFLAAIGALEYLNFDTSMASVRDDAAEIATIIVRHAQSADLAAPDAAQKVAQEIVPACLSRTCFIKDCGRDRCWGCDDSVLERKRVAEIISRHFAIDADAVRQARRETWKEARQAVMEVSGFHRFGHFTVKLKDVVAALGARAEGDKGEVDG